MKKLMLILCLSFACIGAVRSQDTTSINQPQNQERLKIEIRDLPEAIRTSLQGQDYDGWTITAAYKGQMNDPEDMTVPVREIYIVDLRNGDQTTSATFDKDGNPLGKIKSEDQK